MTISNEAQLILNTQKRTVHTKNAYYIFHIPSSMNKGGISIYEGVFYRPGEHKNLHYHKQLTEAFTVLEGEFEFYLKDQELILRPNDSIVIPPNVIHGFIANKPNSRLQIAFTGCANRDGFFVGLAKIVNGEILLDSQEKEQFFNRYDQYTVTGSPSTKRS